MTSLEGAAIRDIINVLRRRYANAHLVIRPARVQGEGAAVEIAHGLRAITRVRGVDVVIVGRADRSVGARSISYLSPEYWRATTEDDLTYELHTDDQDYTADLLRSGQEVNILSVDRTYARRGGYPGFAALQGCLDVGSASLRFTYRA